MSEEAAYRELFLKTALSFLDPRLSAKLKPTSRNLLWIVNYCLNRVRRTQGLEPGNEKAEKIFEGLDWDVEEKDVRPGDLVFFAHPTNSPVEILAIGIISRVSPSIKSLAVTGNRILEVELVKYPLRGPYKVVFRNAGKWFEMVKQLAPPKPMRSNSAHLRTFYLTPGNNSELVKSTLESHGYRRISSQSSAGLVWTQLVKQVETERVQEGKKLVNHLPRLSALITTKKAFRHTTKQIPGFPVPVTYDLSDPYDFMKFVSVTSNSPPTTKWILKPFALNQGIGISIVSNLPQFRKDLHSGRESKQKVIQLYIAQPMLIDGRKFDIRYYVLVARCKPLVVLRYEEYYIRRSLNAFSLESDNLLTHLTNAHQQKSHPDFEEQKETSIWSKAQFTAHFDPAVVSAIEASIISIISRLFAFVVPMMDQKLGSFELLGLDFMVENTGKVYMLEANSNPALYTDTEVLAEVIPKMLKEAVTVVTRAHSFESSGDTTEGTQWVQVFPTR